MRTAYNDAVQQLVTPNRLIEPVLGLRRFGASLASLGELAAVERRLAWVGASQAHADVPDYLLQEIRALGLEPQLQKIR